MSFVAKFMLPLATPRQPPHPLIERALEGGATLFVGRSGHQVAARLVASLEAQRRPALWLRLGPEDGDPATLLVSLIAAAQRLNGSIGVTTLERMQRQPGPMRGWPPLYAHLAREFAAQLPPASVLVLQGAHHLADAPGTLRLFSSHFQPLLPAESACVLTTHLDLPRGSLPSSTALRRNDELRLDIAAARAIAERHNADLSERLVARLVALAEGRAAIIEGVCATAEHLSPAVIQRALQRSRNAHQLLADVALCWLAHTPAPDQRAQALHAHLEYSHPTLIQEVLGCGAPIAGPWLQWLEGGWTRIGGVWQQPLQHVLTLLAPLSHGTLTRAADSLARQSAIERAIPLYIGLREFDSAAQVIAAAANRLMNLGQWESLQRWLSQLPELVIEGWPWLVYTRGEIAAARGRLTPAQHSFSLATRLFKASHDLAGACQSMLAESAVASWQGDQAHAQSWAQEASSAAEHTGVAWYRSWAAWQLGCLLVARGDLHAALVCFQQAAAAADNEPLHTLIDRVKLLAEQQYKLRQQRDFYQQAMAAADQAERETAEELRRELTVLPDNIDALLGSYGWAHTPLLVKLPASAVVAAAYNTQAGSFWSRISRLLGLRRDEPQEDVAVLQEERMNESAASAQAQIVPSLLLLPPTEQPAAEAELPQPTLVQAVAATDEVEPAHARAVGESERLVFVERPLASTHQRSLVAAELPVAPQIIEGERIDQRPSLAIYCLGNFRVYQNDKEITQWVGLRGQAILKYLVAHDGLSISKDTLMDLFWGDAPPDAARRNLHQAIYSLRQTLKQGLAQDDVQHILYEHNCYRLNPKLSVWIDLTEFERHRLVGQHLAAAGQYDEACAAYRIAEELYGGPFLADDLYEEWAQGRREQLRASYIGIVEWLLEQAMLEEEFTQAASLCQKILAQDPAHEAAHRQLIQCYAALGQRHRAIRQYQTCVEVLRDEYDLAPSPETVTLYREIARAS